MVGLKGYSFRVSLSPNHKLKEVSCKKFFGGLASPPIREVLNYGSQREAIHSLIGVNNQGRNAFTIYHGRPVVTEA